MPRRGRVAAAVALASAAAGCGGDAAPVPAPQRPPAAKPAALPELPPEPPPETGAVTGSRERDVRREKKMVELAVGAARRDAERAAQRARRSAARRSAIAAARAAGLEAVTARREGRGIVLRGSEPVCERVDVRALRAALPRSVRVDVARAGCPLAPPSGGGVVLFERGGEGAAALGPVDVPARRWAVEYAAGGTFLSLVATRDGRVLEPQGPVDDLHGRRAFSGSGSIRLQVAGDGPWRLRIRSVASSEARPQP